MMRRQRPRKTESSETVTDIDPLIWGSPLWDLLFVLSYRCDDTNESLVEFGKLFDSLGHILPCKTCRRSYSSHVKKVPPVFKCKEDVSKWLWTIKDLVNQSLKKKYVPYDTIRQKYNTYHSLTNEKTALELFTLMFKQASQERRVHVTNSARSIAKLSVQLFCDAVRDALDNMYDADQ